MTTAAWNACLERFAQHLAGQRSAIRRGDLDALEAFVPDPDLGALPGALQGRAARLRAECDALAEQLAAARDRTTQDLSALTRPRSDAAPSYVDSRV